MVTPHSELGDFVSKRRARARPSRGAIHAFAVKMRFMAIDDDSPKLGVSPDCSHGKHETCRGYFRHYFVFYRCICKCHEG